MAFFACLSFTGAGMASTDPHVEIPETPEGTITERCQKAVEVFHRQIDWINDFMDANPGFDPDDPELTLHRDRMWQAWAIAEFECGIDVGGDGEIG
jgi:hypothetical protein